MVLEGKTLHDFRRSGRIIEKDGIYLGFSGCFIEFNTDSRVLELTVTTDEAIEEQLQARVAIFIDEETQPVLDEMLSEKEKSFKTELGVGIHKVRIEKLSEAAFGYVCVKSITVDPGSKMWPTVAKDRRIEFIGDSITCGYGVDGTLHDSYQTGLEDATKAYAYQTAQLLDADYSLVSMSGYGIYTGYAYAGKPIPEQTMGLYYTTLGNSQGRVAGLVVKDQKWDFSKFKADYVVINLGTNDSSYCKTAETKALYVDAYVEFLKLVRENNKDAVIICALGIMGQDLCSSMQEAITKYSAQTGDTKVLYQKLDNQSGEYAVDYHPTEASHQKAAKQMADFISMLENQ